jgi:DNA-binding MarR family transcriptional regulator
MQDVEAIVSHAPEDQHLELRLWLRLLSCTNLITARIRSKLRETFDITLPRFDVMAQLARSPEGLRLGELSARMMVTGGNLTGIIDALVAEGLVTRETVPTDRRAAIVRLSKPGQNAFARMAADHEAWLAELFSDLKPQDVHDLSRELDTLKQALRRASGKP